MSDEIQELTRVQVVIDDLSSPTDREFVYATDQFSERAIASAAAKIAMEGGGGPGTLPSWWTVNSTPGAESVEFAGAVEIDPGRDVSSLILHGFTGNTEHILRVYDDEGDLALDIDSIGKLDARHIAIQDPPDTGPAAGGSTSLLNPSFWQVSSGADASQDPLQVRRWNAGQGSFNDVFDIGRTAAIIKTAPTNNGHETGWEISSSADTTGNAIELWDYPFNSMLFSVSYTGAITATLPTSNPGPGGLWNDGGTVKVGT